MGRMTKTQIDFAEPDDTEDRIKVRLQQIRGSLQVLTKKLQGASAHLKAIKVRLKKREAYLERVLVERKGESRT